MDYAATTPVDARVAQLMSQYLTTDGDFGNPASRSHAYGWKAEEAVENARRELSDLIAADPREIVWTSGATEANNLALKGVVEAYSADLNGKHIITSCIEHKAVLDTVEYLEQKGVRVTYLSPSSEGTFQLQDIADAMTDETILVSMMYVNNEIGVINNIRGIGELCRSKKVLLHVDAAQAVGKIPVDVKADFIDLMSVSGHKMYGPKGVGALYVRRSPDVKIVTQLHGGGHERNMRSGTLATHQIVGIGEAARICREEIANESTRIIELKKKFWQGISELPDIKINGSLDKGIAGILNVSFAHIEGETLLMSLRKIAVSTGSACVSASVEPSYVLRALKVDDELAHSSIRFSFGRFTTEKEIDIAVENVIFAVTNLRKH